MAHYNGISFNNIFEAMACFSVSEQKKIVNNNKRKNALL